MTSSKDFIALSTISEILTVKSVLQKFGNLYAVRKKNFLRLTRTVRRDRMVRGWSANGTKRSDDARVVRKWHEDGPQMA